MNKGLFLFFCILLLLLKVDTILGFEGILNPFSQQDRYSAMTQMQLSKTDLQQGQPSSQQGQIVPGEQVFPASASMAEKIRYLSSLICAFLNPEEDISEELKEGGQLFYAWQYWITWKLGEKESGVTNREINLRVEAMIADLYQQHREFEVALEMKQDLRNLARHDIAVERMIARIKKEEGVDSVSASQIINYLGRKYNDADIRELENLFRFFGFITTPLTRLIGLSLYPFYSTDAGLITGTVLKLWEEFEKEFGKNFVLNSSIIKTIEEEFDELVALKPHIEDLLGKKINFFHPNGADFGFLRAFAAQVEGGLKDPPSEYMSTPVWKWPGLGEKRTLEYVINKRIPRVKFIKAIAERAYGHVFDLVNNERDANYVMHIYDVAEERNWTEYDVLENLAPSFDKWLIGAVRGLYQKFDWTNCFNANRPVSLDYQNMSVSNGIKNSLYVPEDRRNWRPYAYLALEINTGVSNASSVLSITIRNNLGEKAEYRVPLYNLPRGSRVEVKIPLRRYVVDSTGDEIPDRIVWDGFIKDASWKNYVYTSLDTDMSLCGIRDFGQIISVEFSSSDGDVIFNIK